MVLLLIKQFLVVRKQSIVWLREKNQGSNITIEVYLLLTTYITYIYLYTL